MANFSATSSGDFTSYIAGKVFNAGNMAKGERTRREQEGIEQAQPGSLFGRALQSEFGGDLYSRSFGAFDPRKAFNETDRNSSKEARFTAQFPEAKETNTGGDSKPSGSSQEVERAQDDLLRDDDKAVPVKDKDLRSKIARIFGGVEIRLGATDAKLNRVSDNVLGVQKKLVDTQKLIVDQNIVLETKFDQILEIFGKQIEFQKELAEDAKIAARENELEEQKDLSTTRSILSTGGGSNDLSTSLLQFLGRKIGKRLAKPAKKSLKKIASKVAPKLTQRVSQSAANNTAGKVLQKSNIVTRALRSKVVQRALIKKFGKEGAEKLTLKVVGKLVPGVSTAYGAIEGISRIAMGDIKGGFLSFGSAIPVAGYGFAAIDIFRDIDADAYTKHIEPNLPKPSEENIGAFFSEALGVGPSEYERGTLRSKRGLASPGPAMAHGTEAILTPEDRKSITEFTVDSLRSVGSRIISTGIAFGNSSGNGPEVRAIFNKFGLDYKIQNVAFRSNIGKGRTATGQFNLSSMLSEIPGAISSMMSPNRNNGGRRFTNAGNNSFDNLPGDYQEMYDYMISKDVSPNHAMGMILNLARESGGDPSIMANWEGSGTDSNGLPSGGLFQWNGARFEAMKKYVGNDWESNWKKQIDFALEEKDTTSGGYEAYAKKDFSSPMDAAEWWLTKWERGNDVARDMGKMRTIMSSFRAQGLTVSSSSSNWSPEDYLTAPSGVKIDDSGEPGVDFTPAGSNNRAMFDGVVISKGNQYNASAMGGDRRKGSGYGNHIIIRGKDPKNNKEFDALYAHFPKGELNKWKSGDRVTRGQVLGRMATEAEFKDPLTRPQVGSGTGPHTSLDFFPKGGPYTSNNPYRHWRRNLLPLIDPSFGSINNQSGGKNAKSSTQGGGNGISSTGMFTKDKGGTGGPGKLNFRNGIERRTYNALNSKGFTAAQISAIMANFDIETGGYRTMYQDGGPGRGLAQWETPGRWDQALQWYKSKGKNPKNLINDVEGQIDWMMHEFTNHPTDSQDRPSLPYGFSYTLNDWKSSSKDPVELARSWMNWYEAPGTPHPTQRFASALRYSKMLPRSSAEIDAQIRKNDADKLKYKNDPAGFFGSIPNRNTDSLYANSSMAEDMEDSGMVKVQFVIVNNLVSANRSSSVNSKGSSSTSDTSLSDLHIASLGA